MNNYHTIITIAGIVCFTALHAEQKSGIAFQGSMYTDIGFLHTVHSSSKDEADFAGMSVLSLNLKNTNRTYGKIEGLFDVIVPYGSMVGRFIPSMHDSISHGIILDMYKLFSFGNAPVLFDLRKLCLSFYLPFADVTLGRQIINFGHGLVFSPVDVFSRVELQDINFRRRGADIASIRLPFADLAGLDITTQLPFLDEDHATAAKLFATILDFDFSLIGMYRHAGSNKTLDNEAILGLTFKGDMGIGIYGENAVHILTNTKEIFYEGMLGADYSIRDRWYFVAEYLYKQYAWRNSQWGEHNLLGSIRCNFNDLTNLSVTAIHDFGHETTTGIIQWYYSLHQNVNTIAYVQGADTRAGTFLLYALRADVKF